MKVVTYGKIFFLALLPRRKDPRIAAKARVFGLRWQRLSNFNNERGIAAVQPKCPICHIDGCEPRLKVSAPRPWPQKRSRSQRDQGRLERALAFLETKLGSANAEAKV